MLGDTQRVVFKGRIKTQEVVPGDRLGFQNIPDDDGLKTRPC